jgi:hypothetical protein
VRFAGDGATLYADTIARAAPLAEIIGHPPLAGAIGRMAFIRRQGALDPAGVRPLYVRRPDAEIDRDRRQTKHIP